jgi:hypothetical protein
MNLSKWASNMGPIFAYLGFTLNLHLMVVTWPLWKRKELSDLVLVAIKKTQCSFSEAASIVGKLRPAADVAPWGIFIVWALSQELSGAVRQASGMAKSRGFWKRTLRLIVIAVLVDG